MITGDRKTPDGMTTNYLGRTRDLSYYCIVLSYGINKEIIWFKSDTKYIYNRPETHCSWLCFIFVQMTTYKKARTYLHHCYRCLWMNGKRKKSSTSVDAHVTCNLWNVYTQRVEIDCHVTRHTLMSGSFPPALLCYSITQSLHMADMYCVQLPWQFPSLAISIYSNNNVVKPNCILIVYSTAVLTWDYVSNYTGMRIHFEIRNVKYTRI